MREGDDMDMNWQAMLHEAADASFEKNRESLAAADNDACSYADLPKAKIQELSEKILYLPHQGIVLHSFPTRRSSDLDRKSVV